MPDGRLFKKPEAINNKKIEICKLYLRNVPHNVTLILKQLMPKKSLTH